jgi:hypothetical protein
MRKVALAKTLATGMARREINQMDGKRGKRGSGGCCSVQKGSERHNGQGGCEEVDLIDARRGTAGSGNALSIPRRWCESGGVPMRPEDCVVSQSRSVVTQLLEVRPGDG